MDHSKHRNVKKKGVKAVIFFDHFKFCGMKGIKSTKRKLPCMYNLTLEQ